MTYLMTYLMTPHDIPHLGSHPEMTEAQRSWRSPGRREDMESDLLRFLQRCSPDALLLCAAKLVE